MNITFYCPVNLDVRAIVRQVSINTRYINCKVDKIHWFLTALYLRPLIDKHYSHGDFIPMSRRKMDEILGSDDVTDILDILRESGIIEDDGYYVEGEKSIGYRLTAPYQVRHVQVQAGTNPSFIAKLSRMKEDEVGDMDAVTLYTLQQLGNLGIRKNAAISFVENWYEEQLQSEYPRLMNKLRKQNRKLKQACNRAIKMGRNVQYVEITYTDMLEKMMQSYLLQIEAVHTLRWLPKRDDKGTRIHTYLTNLWRPLKQFLYLKDNPELQIVALDCSNSQPFTLVKILLGHFKGDDFSTGTPEDVQFYIYLVCNGRLYDFMCDMLDITDEGEITDFKIDMFARVFFPPNHKGYHTKEATMFRQHFPTVYEVVMQEKREWDFEEKRFKYENLSINMQKVETAAVIDGVLTRLMGKYGMDVWFSTIHDSVLCPAAYEQEVRSLMLQCYTAVVGATPHIKQAEKVNVVNPETISEIESQEMTQRKTLTALKPSEDKKMEKKKATVYVYLSDSEVWELQESEEWGDEVASMVLRHVESINELDFNGDDMPFYRRAYRIEKRYWKQAA